VHTCSALSLYGLAGHQAIQYVGTEIHLVWPDDSSDFQVNPNLLKEPYVLEWGEYAAAANNSFFEIKLTFRIISEAQFQTIFSKMTHLLNSREHVCLPTQGV